MGGCFHLSCLARLASLGSLGGRGYMVGKGGGSWVGVPNSAELPPGQMEAPTGTGLTQTGTDSASVSKRAPSTHSMLRWAEG